MLGPSLLDLQNLMDLRIGCTLGPILQDTDRWMLSLSSAGESSPCSTGWWQIILFLLFLLLVTITVAVNVLLRVTYLGRCLSFCFFTEYVCSQRCWVIFFFLLLKLNALILMRQSRTSGRYLLFLWMIDLKQDGTCINLRLKKYWLWK